MQIFPECAQVYLDLTLASADVQSPVLYLKPQISVFFADSEPVTPVRSLQH